MVRINGFLHSYVDMVGFLQHGGSHSGAALGDIILDASGQMHLGAFGGSGQLEYRFGPYEMWAAKTSSPPDGSPAGDGFWPIPHSGNVNEMIALALPTLQTGYENNNNVFVTSAFGDLGIASQSAKFRIASSEERSHIQLSGVLAPASVDHERGDLTFMLHQDSEDGSLPTSEAEARAQSLGYGQLVYDTGSGIVNLVTGSGIMEIKNDTSAQTFTTGTVTIGLLTAGIPDKHYHIDTTNDQIVILVPGLYHFHYAVNTDVTSGASRSIIRVRLLHNGTALTRYNSYAYAREATAGEGTCRNAGFLLLEAGDTLELQANRDIGGNTCAVLANETHIGLWHVGPLRTGVNDA